MATTTFSTCVWRVPTGRSQTLSPQKSSKYSQRRRKGYHGSSFFAFPLHPPGLTNKNLHRKHPIAVSCSTSAYTGRVGTHRREGNVSLASFGINPKRFPNGLRLDFAQSLSGMLPLIVGGTAAAALINPATFAWQEENVCRTISLCTGMQSSTLAGLLATQFLGNSHAVPAACSVVAMAIMGLTLASFWGRGHRITDIPANFLARFNTPLNAEGVKAFS